MLQQSGSMARHMLRLLFLAVFLLAGSGPAEGKTPGQRDIMEPEIFDYSGGSPAFSWILLSACAFDVSVNNIPLGISPCQEASGSVSVLKVPAGRKKEANIFLASKQNSSVFYAFEFEEGKCYVPRLGTDGIFDSEQQGEIGRFYKHNPEDIPLVKIQGRDFNCEIIPGRFNYGLYDEIFCLMPMAFSDISILEQFGNKVPVPELHGIPDFHGTRIDLADHCSGSFPYKLIDRNRDRIDVLGMSGFCLEEFPSRDHVASLENIIEINLVHQYCPRHIRPVTPSDITFVLPFENSRLESLDLSGNHNVRIEIDREALPENKIKQLNLSHTHRNHDLVSFLHILAPDALLDLSGNHYNKIVIPAGFSLQRLVLRENDLGFILMESRVSILDVSKQNSENINIELSGEGEIQKVIYDCKFSLKDVPGGIILSKEQDPSRTKNNSHTCSENIK